VRDLGDPGRGTEQFFQDNRESLGTTSDKLASVPQALKDTSPTIKEVLPSPRNAAELPQHYQPLQGTLTGAFVSQQLSNPITFLWRARFRLPHGWSRSPRTKLCVQYLHRSSRTVSSTSRARTQSASPGRTARPTS